MSDSSGASSGKRKMPRGRPFQPGQSGNPGGRMKVPADVREAARAHTALAIATLADLLANGTEATKARVADILLDRAWGKAPAVMAGEGGEGEAGLTVTIRDMAKEAKPA